MRLLKIVLAVGIVCLATTSWAQTTPRTIAFNGVALDANGQPMTGLRGMTFAIYTDQVGGSPLWLEIQAVNVDAAGRYGVFLGASSAQGVPMALFSSGQARWLGVQVEGRPEQARVFLAAVPYALKAADAETVGGLPVTSFVLVDDPNAPAGGAGTPSSSAVASNDKDVPTRDVFYADDLIVDGSLAVGFDTVNGENFGFDTIRLKENNLRIHFDDTSTSGSFPNNDWRIVINDSANGGGNYFAIEDSTAGRQPFRVEAGARSNALYVESDGDVGLGTTNPVLNLHVVDGDSPAVRMEQNGSSGFAPQTWDMAGNETNFFIRDATNGSKLPFRIRPNAPSSSIDIEGTTGDVGIGTGSPVAPLHVRRTNGTARVVVEEANGTNAARSLLRLQNNGGAVFNLANSANGTQWDLALQNSDRFTISKSGSGALEFELASDGSLKLKSTSSPTTANMDLNGITGNVVFRGTVNGSSSRAVKERIEWLEPTSVLERLITVPIAEWSYTFDPRQRHVGPMAEDFYDAFGLGMDAQHIAPADSAGVALAAVKGLYERLRDKDSEIATLEARIAALEELVQQLTVALPK